MTHRLSRSLDQLAPRYDVIVVGSGYGAAIAASRLARAGQSVCVLERGREHGSFPNDPADAGAELSFTVAREGSDAEHFGNRCGLFDFRVGDDISVLQGNGLGGTSLINANVALPPTMDVFERPEWPRALTADGGLALERGFERARAMLEPQSYPEHRTQPRKLLALEQSAAGMGVAECFSRPPINVAFERRINAAGVLQNPCTDCGDCVTGCNEGSKGTLTQNYLPDAVRHGAQIFTECAVRHVERRGDDWVVYFDHLGTGREQFGDEDLFVTAERVVLGAGALGSTEILMRSAERGLALSGRLGARFTGNGDVLAFAYNADEPIDGIGAGDEQPDAERPVGPCITGLIDLRGRPGLERDMVVEEGSLPGSLEKFLAPAMKIAAGLTGEDTDGGFTDEVLELWRRRGLGREALRHTQTFLVMSHDDGEGRMELAGDSLRIAWPGYADQPIFDDVDRTLKAATEPLGATYVRNPGSHELLGDRMVTVHPLGGCAMGDDAERGVVDHAGRVFAGSTGTEVHPDLFVLDGSIIPRPLGVNPLLTISALAERACEQIVDDAGWHTSYATWTRNQPAPLPQDGAPATGPGVQFTETMRGWMQRGSDAVAGPEAAERGRADDCPFEFTLTISIDDVEAFARDPHAVAAMTGTAIAPALSDQPMTVHDGRFQLFVPDAERIRQRRMRYSMTLATVGGERFHFDGWKEVRDDRGLDVVADTTTLFFQVDSDTRERTGAGQLVIEPADFARQLTTMRATGAESTLERLGALATFGRLFAGNLLDVYAPFFAGDSALRADAPPRDRRPLAAPTPEVIPFAAEDGTVLRLTRYRGGDRRPVMLAHGLGVSSRIFSTDTIDRNLVEHLCADGHDVWLLDYRASIELEAAAQAATGDDIATLDYPAAVAEIRRRTGADSIDAVVHCFGGTTFFMSMLAGLEGIHSIVTSQTAAHVDAPLMTRLKSGLYLPETLDLLGVDTLTAYSGAHPTWRSSLFDRFLRLQPIEAEERCSSSVCHRIFFLYGQLYEHDRINHLTHESMHELFGLANIEAFEHLAELVRSGHLVGADGSERYLPHLDRLDLPITFIHGAENACFHPSSTRKTFDAVVERFGSEPYRYHLIDGYGHIDCMFGRDAARDVYPHILDHLNRV